MTTIVSVFQLQDMQNDLAGDYVLGNDINASITSGWNGGEGFIPIGQNSPYFTGTFDGKGYTISNLTINRPTEDEIGLFGVSSGATISNLRVEGAFTGDDSVGALAGGIGGGTVTNCSTDAVVVADTSLGGGFAGVIWGGAVVTDCHSEGTVDEGVAVFSAYGGFAGWIGTAAVITRCYSAVDVTAPTASSVGGFVGYCSEATFSRCFASGDVFGSGDTGGFVGTGGWGNGVTTTIEDCYARGAVHTVSSGASGFCSGNTGFSGSALIIRNSYGTGAVSSDAGFGSDYVAGFFYSKSSGTVTVSNCFWDRESTGVTNSLYGTSKSTAQMKTKSTFTDVSWDFVLIWGITAAINDGYPFLRPLGVRYFAWII